MSCAVFNFAPIQGDPRADGSRILAGFDAVLAGLRLIGCVVIQQANGSLIASPPEAKARHVRDLTIKIIDPALDQKFQSAAIAAYLAFAEGEPRT